MSSYTSRRFFSAWYAAAAAHDSASSAATGCFASCTDRIPIAICTTKTRNELNNIRQPSRLGGLHFNHRARWPRHNPSAPATARGKLCSRPTADRAAAAHDCARQLHEAAAAAEPRDIAWRMQQPIGKIADVGDSDGNGKGSERRLVVRGVADVGRRSLPAPIVEIHVERLAREAADHPQFVVVAEPTIHVNGADLRRRACVAE